MPNPIINNLAKQTEFWSAEITRDELNREIYFKKGSDDMETDGTARWPEALREISDDEICLSAFGGLLFYLRSVF